MAERRMFAKTIIDSDAFIDMPITARLLYYDLGMRADDDGFVNSPKKIMRMVGASQDDLAILISKKFIIPFETGVVVIKHWRIHNHIRQDRKHETKYEKEMAQLTVKENGAYTLTDTCQSSDSQMSVTCQSSDSQMSVTCPTEVRLGKDRLGKDKDIEKRKRFNPPSLEDVKAYCIERKNNVDPNKFIDYYESNGWMVGRNKMKDWKAAVRSWEKNSYDKHKHPTVTVPVPDYIERQISGILPEHKKATQETLDAVKKMQSEMKW